MDFGALPPEINSARMYSGPGSTPLLAAATAWDGLATELRSTAVSYSWTISQLTSSWQGPAATRMAAAITPYVTWLTATGAHAEQTANQARAAAAAYETAFAATVPPPAITANRAQRATLITSNIFGQNTAAIAATDAQYASMWSHDAAAMYGYASQATKATQLTPFDAPPQTTNPPSALQNLTAPAAAADPPATLAGLVDGLNSSPLAFIAEHVELMSDAILPANSALINTIIGVGLATKGLDVAAGSAAGGAMGPALVAGPGAASLGSAGLIGAGSAVSASVGHAGSVGGLAVPTSWAASTPAIRTVAAVFSGTAESAVSAAAVSQGSLLSSVASASVAGAAVSRVGAGTGIRSRGEGATGRKDLKDTNSPQDLQRLVAQIAENPESVQHWHTDSENLDDLLAVLQQKPGTHAVHLKTGKSRIAPPHRQG